MAVLSVTYYVFVFISEGEFYFIPSFFFFSFFCSCKGRRMWYQRNRLFKQEERSEVAFSSIGTHFSTCYVLTCLWWLYIFIYICMYFSLNYWCLIAQGCRKSYKVLRALWELEWFMRLCCFCSMRKLDVAYRILPCCYCCRVCSCCLALMLRHVAESALSIHALSAWP